MFTSKKILVFICLYPHFITTLALLNFKKYFIWFECLSFTVNCGQVKLTRVKTILVDYMKC